MDTLSDPPAASASSVAELCIDHLMTKVDSPREAGDWFERCGFSVTPYSEIDAMGLCNRLVLFDPGRPGLANFVELMGVLPDRPVQPAMNQLLAGPAGPRSMVMVSQDAHATRDELLRRGFAPGPVHSVQREWVLPGERLHLAFDVLLPMPAPLPFNVCRYHTLQHYLRPQWLKHPNGARSMAAVLGVVDDVAQAAQFYETLLGAPARDAGPGHAVVVQGPAALELLDAAAYARLTGSTVLRQPGLAGYRLRCDDARATAGWFERAGAAPAWREQAGAWQVAALGCDIFLA